MDCKNDFFSRTGQVVAANLCNEYHFLERLCKISIGIRLWHWTDSFTYETTINILKTYSFIILSFRSQKTECSSNSTSLRIVTLELYYSFTCSLSVFLLQGWVNYNLLGLYPPVLKSTESRANSQSPVVHKVGSLSLGWLFAVPHQDFTELRKETGWEGLQDSCSNLWNQTTQPFLTSVTECNYPCYDDFSFVWTEQFMNISAMSCYIQNNINKQ